MSLRHVFRTDIDLDSPVEGCEHFFWRELLFLSNWGVFIFPTREHFQNLTFIARKAEIVRSILRSSLTVTSALRPPAYNAAIGGAKNSAHLEGLALDLVPDGMTADRARFLLVPHLDSLQIRLENLPGSSWIHCDLREPGPGGRYFVP